MMAGRSKSGRAATAQATNSSEGFQSGASLDPLALLDATPKEGDDGSNKGSAGMVPARDGRNARPCNLPARALCPPEASSFGSWTLIVPDMFRR